MNRRMNKIRGRMRARSSSMQLKRAIAQASTPAMRDELLEIAQRQA